MASTTTHKQHGINGTQSATPRQKGKRFEARLSLAQYEILEMAAAIEGRSLSEFVMTAAQEAAKQTIKDHRILTLSDCDSAVFAKVLLAPWEPSQEALEDASRMRVLFDEE